MSFEKELTVILIASFAYAYCVGAVILKLLALVVIGN